MRPIEGYRDRFILYGCGNLIDASEGLAIYERLHDDLAVLYFATLAPGSGALLELAMTPMKIRRLQLTRAFEENVTWLETTLDEINRGFGTRVARVSKEKLALRG